MTKLLSKLKSRAKNSDDHWIPLSDLMSGLMMMFMLIAVMYIIEHKAITEIQKCEADVLRRNVSAVKRLTEVYEKSQKDLRDALELRLRSDLAKWGAELREDFTIRFNDPKTLFLTGQSTLTSRFREILSNFMPQYISILYDPKFRDLITEIRIEGHTSSIWNAQTPADKAYMLNMELSQSRTRSVLDYSLSLPRDEVQQKWLVSLLTANGLSSSRPVLDAKGENIESSQRVEFRVRTNSESKLIEVINAVDGDWAKELEKCKARGPV